MIRSSSRSTLLAMALSLLSTSVAGAAEERAHPTNYPHRHVEPGYGPPAQPSPVYRQGKWHPRGSVYFGIGGLGNVFFEQQTQITQVYRGGGGFELFLGARLNDYVAFEASWLAAFQRTATTSTQNGNVSPIGASVMALDVNAKIYIVPWLQRIEPFVQLGVGAYFLTESFVQRLTGFGLDVGLGVDIRFSPVIGIGVRAVYRGFYVDNREQSYNNIPTQAAWLNMMTFEGNLQFHF